MAAVNCKMMLTRMNYSLSLTMRQTGSACGCLLAKSYTTESAKKDHTEKEDSRTEADSDSLYTGHIPTTFLQKSLLSVGSAAMAISRPWRDDMVAILGETTGSFALQSMRKRMLADTMGRRILEEKPRINSGTVDLKYLETLPEGTFGREYADFLKINRISPDTRRDVNFVDDAELAYVMQRYREVHDLMHTILGMPTNMLGEVVVKWVEGIQTGLPMCVSGALFGPVRLRQKHMQKYLESHMWWAIRNGYNAKFLMNVYYEEHWETPMEEFRKYLNLEEPPKTPPKKHDT